MDDEAYTYTQEDVEKMLRMLRLNVPKFATPENAVKVLVYMREHTRKIEETSPEELEEILRDLEEH